MIWWGARPCLLHGQRLKHPRGALLLSPLPSQGSCDAQAYTGSEPAEPATSSPGWALWCCGLGGGLLCVPGVGLSLTVSMCPHMCFSVPTPSAISKQRLPFPCQRLRGVFSHLRPENVVGLLEKPTEVCRPQAGSPGISCTRLQPVPAPLACIPGWPQHWSLPDERWARVCSHLCDGVCPVTSHCQRL